MLGIARGVGWHRNHPSQHTTEKCLNVIQSGRACKKETVAPSARLLQSSSNRLGVIA